MIKNVNDFLLNILWGTPMVLLIILTGLFISVKTHFFQIRYFGYILKSTLFSLFKKDTLKSGGEPSISRFQAISTALAGTLGTGNIVGVTSALSMGGSGAIFWMWISAVVGMITKYAENVLAIYFRQKNKKGEWQGGAMYYIKNGLSSNCLLNPMAKPLSFLFSLFCLGASFGVGNMVQINSVSNILKNTWNVPLLTTGVISSIIIFIIIIKGLKSIVKVTERLIPLVSVLYTATCITIIYVNKSSVPFVFEGIFKNAFGFKAMYGAAIGTGLKTIISTGFKRGIFSNEAGLGASATIHAQSDTKEPCEQGMWGIFEVFFDTIVSCTLTALAVLSSGVNFLEENAATVIHNAFFTVFGKYTGSFLATAMSLFAFSTIIGWSFYGTSALRYISGEKHITLYKILYSLAVIPGATLNLALVWEISDTLNALMAIPNLIAVISLSGIVSKITNNYIERKMNGKKIKPMLSAFKDY